MKGVVFTFIFFVLGFAIANTPAEERLAISTEQAESTQRIPFEAIKVFSNEVKIEYPGLKYAKVKSDSMAPWLTHDSVVFEKVPTTQDEILVGDVISFYEPSVDAIILHMVVDIVEKDGKAYYQTKGIANKEADEWLVPFENVKGIMVGTVR